MSQLGRRHAAEASHSGGLVIPQYLTLFTVALAVAGLGELVLQRVVYRVGIHLPRSGLFLNVYEFATAAGDFAFRLTAVLVGVSAVALALWLARGRVNPLVGAVLLALVAVNLFAWPLRLEPASVVVAVLFAVGLAAVLAGAARRPAPLALHAAVVGAALTLLLGQYRVLLGGLGVTGESVATAQLLSEVGLLLTAAALVLATRGFEPSRHAVAAAAGVTILLAGAYVREPATVAIVSLWAVGVTMSLPAVLYLFALAGVTYAAATWLRREQTRHLGVAVLLLLVAGVQPEILHHDLTALLGLTLLSLGAAQTIAESRVGGRLALAQGAS